MMPQNKDQPDSPRSWVVAGIGALAMIFTFGTPLSYGIFRDPFSETFGVSPIALSIVFALMLFTLFIGSGLVGVFGARFPARAVLLGCALATGLVSPSLYFVESFVGLTVVFAVLGLALGTAFVVVASIVPQWFDARRGVAMGLIFVGNGVGLFVLPPVWQRAFADVGVRQGFLVVISVTTIAFLLAALVCRRPQWANPSTATTGELIEWLSRLGTSRTFQLLFVGVALSFAWWQLLAAFAVDLFTHYGLTESTASLAFGLIGGISIASRLGSGYLADHVGTRRAFLGSLVCVAAGMGLLFVPAIPALAGAIFLAGLGLGGTATLYLPLIMEVYSPEQDTAIVGVFQIASGVTALAMPPLGTAAVTYTDGFTVPVTLTFVLTVAAIWAVAAGTRASRGGDVRTVAGSD